MRLAADVRAGRRLVNHCPRDALSPQAFGVTLTRRGLRSRSARFALGRYLDALALVLGADWLTQQPVACPLLTSLRVAAARVPPCNIITCPSNLVGHISPDGWPVLYRWTAAARGEETCALWTDAETLESIGDLWGISREAVRLIAGHAIERARRRLLAAGVVDSRADRRAPCDAP